MLNVNNYKITYPLFMYMLNIKTLISEFESLNKRKSLIFLIVFCNNSNHKISTL